MLQCVISPNMDTLLHNLYETLRIRKLLIKYYHQIHRSHSLFSSSTKCLFWASIPSRNVCYIKLLYLFSFLQLYRCSSFPHLSHPSQFYIMEALCSLCHMTLSLGLPSVSSWPDWSFLGSSTIKMLLCSYQCITSWGTQGWCLLFTWSCWCLPGFSTVKSPFLPEYINTNHSTLWGKYPKIMPISYCHHTFIYRL